MKLVKLSLFIILWLLFLQATYSKVDLDDFDSEIYNLGDKVLISGYVARDSATRGNLDLSLRCDTGEASVGSILIDVNAGESQRFSQLVLVPSNVLGKCSLVFRLIDEISREGLETTVFNAFTASNKLEGAFDITKQELQLGDILNLKGSINKKGNSNVDGLAIIYFKLNGNVSFTDGIDFRDGVLDYSRDMSFVPPNKYVLDIEVSDGLGNKAMFNDVYTVDVSGNIVISANFNNKVYQPGDNVELNGFVSGKYRDLLDDVTMEFDFGDDLIKRELSGEATSFSVAYPTAENIRSGDHEVAVKARADGGNYGKTVFNYSIKAVPTTLSIDVTKDSYIPEDKVGFVVTLLDQAGDEMDGSITGSLVYDNDIVSSGMFTTNRGGSLELPPQASPGRWELKVNGLGLSSEDSFEVEEYEKLSVKAVGDVLIVENKGNIDYDNDLLIGADELFSKKKINLDVGEAEEIKLGKLFPEGTYDTVKVLGEEFKNVHISETGLFSGLKGITGNVGKNLNYGDRKIGIGLLLLFITGCMLFLFMKKKGKFNNDLSGFKGKKYNELRRKRDFEEGRRMADELRMKGIRKDKPKTYDYGVASEEDIADFKERMRNQVADDADKPKGGLMGMFG